MARTNLGDSFRTVPPVAPISGRAKIIARNTFRYVTTEGATVTRLHLTDVVQVIASRRVPGALYGRKVAGVLNVEAGLHYIDGNSAPYFSLTGTVHRLGFPEQCWSGGACHDEILKAFPRFADLAALHLCDVHGAPWHAVANGLYWLAGAMGGLGRRYHGASGAGAKTALECRAVALSHFRCAEAELDALIVQLTKVEPDAHESAVAAFVDGLRDRWKAEAAAVIQRHGLQLCGDVAAWERRAAMNSTAAAFAETLARLAAVEAPASEDRARAAGWRPDESGLWRNPAEPGKVSANARNVVEDWL